MTMGAIPIIPIVLLIWLGLVSGCKVNMFFKSLKNAVEELQAHILKSNKVGKFSCTNPHSPG